MSTFALFGVPSKDCPICHAELGGMYNRDNVVVRIQSCGHRFHDKCLREWILRSQTCPVCRTRVTPGELKRMNYTNFESFKPKLFREIENAVDSGNQVYATVTWRETDGMHSREYGPIEKAGSSWNNTTELVTMSMYQNGDEYAPEWFRIRLNEDRSGDVSDFKNERIQEFEDFNFRVGN